MNSSPTPQLGQLSSPHKGGELSTNQVMRMVAYATVPAILCQIYFFGWGVVVQLIIASLTALATEAVMLSLREKPVRRTLMDGSAVLTGILLALSIPPLAPWWLVVIGVVFSIAVVKQLYGGLGHNLFNPAMAGYVVLLISFPVAMTSWLPPMELTGQATNFIDTAMLIFTGYSLDGYSVNQLRMGFDGMTMATPLDHLKTELSQGYGVAEILTHDIYNSYAGKGWFWVNVAFLVGGLWLLKNKLIRWHIPVSFLATLTLLTFISYAFNPDLSITPLLTLFSGATMFAAFFILTDPVAAATSPKGRIIFGAFAAVLVFAIRQWGGYPDGIAFAVLLANMTVPLIDYYTRPVVYGHKKANHE